MGSKTDVDSLDEVRKLQDKVRKLEFQNEQLRSQHTRNGLVGNKILSSISNENYLVQMDHHIETDDDILKINSDEFLDEERWLYIPQSSAGRNVPDNLQKWFRQDVDNNNDYEFQLMRRKLIRELDEIEQGLRRNNIDTRTFTRSKKRMTRPSLETMVESPLFENRRKNFSPWRTAHLQHTEDIDDISFQLHTSMNSTFGSSASESFLRNSHLSSNEMMHFNSFLQKIASDPHLNLTPELKNSTFQKTVSDPDELNAAFQKLSEPDLNTTFLKVSDPCLPVNRKSVDMNATYQLTSKSRSITPLGLNCTFSIQDGSSSSSNRSGRTVSCDSGGDDDQLSSASDSSFSSSNRLMNVGDVQNIARIQEESLKQVMSTPKNKQKREGVTLGSEEDLPSPIHKDLNHGYQSDHSDHSSSADGRARSSRSSLKSSPGGSPFGSTQILTNVPESVPCNAVVGLARRELKLFPAGKQEIPKPQQVVVKSAETMQASRGRGMSGLRPPAMRSRGESAGTARPPTQGRASSIPRPASRIPPPRIRTTAYSAQPSNNKVNWMDGCY